MLDDVQKMGHAQKFEKKKIQLLYCLQIMSLTTIHKLKGRLENLQGKECFLLDFKNVKCHLTLK